mgnify:CR=1 FL=1
MKTNDGAGNVVNCAESRLASDSHNSNDTDLCTSSYIKLDVDKGFTFCSTELGGGDSNDSDVVMTLAYCPNSDICSANRALYIKGIGADNDSTAKYANKDTGSCIYVPGGKGSTLMLTPGVNGIKTDGQTVQFWLTGH